MELFTTFMAGSGTMSIPHTDFEVDFIRELRTAGAAEADAEAYVKGLRGRGVIVLPRVRTRRWTRPLKL